MDHTMQLTTAFIAIIALLAGSAVAQQFDVAQPVVAQQPAADQKPVTEARWLHTEVDAVAWAFEALSHYSDQHRPYVRFVYMPPWATKEWVGAMDVAVNLAANHTTTLIRGDRHAGGWLLAYRLDLLAPDPKVRDELVRIWDFVATRESRFHVPDITIATGKKTALLAPHLQAALAQRAGDGDPKRVDVLVTQLTRSTGGIYPADFLIEQLLTSQRGLYAEFRQMFGANRKFLPLHELMRRRGFYLDASIDIGGEKGALLLISDVTGKSRVILTTFGLGGGVPMVTTFDFKDAKIRPDQQFIRNVVDFRPQSDASEVFIPMPNGLVEFVLADSRGNIQRAAPPDIVADDSKPRGHTKELEMGMSCVMCHFPNNGYNVAKNDMELLLGSDVDFFGDDFSHGGKKLSREQAVALVAGRFGQRIDEPDGILGRARRDFVKAIDQLTDYPLAADGSSSVQQVGEQLKTIYHRYRYGRIDADRACLELGLEVPAGSGKKWLRTIAPAPASGDEDIVIGLLRNGAEIKRDDFDAIYVEMAGRVARYREANKKK
jgi:hypothetical protein